MITSVLNFKYFVTALLMIFVVAYFFVDLKRLSVALKNRKDPSFPTAVSSDQIFGVVMGITIAAIAVVGTIRWYVL